MKPSPTTIIKRFGSWNEARKEAGLEMRGRGERKYSDEDILEALREHSELFSNQWMEKKMKPSASTIIRRFGSWTEARKVAGLNQFK